MFVISAEFETVFLVEPACGHIVGLRFEADAWQVPRFRPFDGMIHQPAAEARPAKRPVDLDVIDLRIAVPAFGDDHMATDPAGIEDRDHGAILIRRCFILVEFIGLRVGFDVSGIEERVPGSLELRGHVEGEVAVRNIACGNSLDPLDPHGRPRRIRPSRYR
ncbi:hypothetical protein LCM4573_22255 [Rhizobium sp. LCM 4573]|nr:hypothetical protein LCM4573_22255 [Rhizobium sp. LCM 4573]